MVGTQSDLDVSGKGIVRLRDALKSDLPDLFEHPRDPVANQMVAFTAKDPNDRTSFIAHSARILQIPKTIWRAVLLDDRIVGTVGFFEMFGKPSISYWYGREIWGRGIATRTLAEFLRSIPTRPVFARVAKDNIASIRVLEKCGFRQVGEDHGFAHARGKEIEEWIFERTKD